MIRYWITPTSSFRLVIGDVGKRWCNKREQGAGPLRRSRQRHQTRQWQKWFASQRAHCVPLWSARLATYDRFQPSVKIATPTTKTAKGILHRTRCVSWYTTAQIGNRIITIAAPKVRCLNAITMVHTQEINPSVTGAIKQNPRMNCCKLSDIEAVSDRAVRSKAVSGLARCAAPKELSCAGFLQHFAVTVLHKAFEHRILRV